MREKNFRFLLKHKVIKAMNKDTLHSKDQHQQILLLLPWFLTQSLELSERQQVENHLRSCMLCRRELVNLEKLAAAVKQSSDLDVAAGISFDGLREKLQSASSARQQSGLSVVPQSVDRHERHGDATGGLSGNAPNRHKPFWAFFGTQGRRLAIAASLLLAMTPLVMHYGRPLMTADYYTLSDPKPEAVGRSQLRVVFSKSLSDTDINALLGKIHGQRVEGPNSVGAYTVRLDSGEDAPALFDAIAFLRKQQDVMLAEPVSN